MGIPRSTFKPTRSGTKIQKTLPHTINESTPEQINKKKTHTNTTKELPKS